MLDLAPYLLLGFFLAGLVYVLIPRVGIHKVFGKPGFASVLKASLFGVPLPLCSCSVLPTALSLREKGASRGATLAFLVATPESGVDSIAVSAALLDPLMTIFRPLAAFGTGMVAGLIEDGLEATEPKQSEKEVELCKICPPGMLQKGDHEHNWKEKLSGALRYAFEDLFADIIGWVLLGLLISALISVFLPPDFFAKHVEGESAQFLLMLLVGIPLYVCASASTPIAASLIHAGISPGAALVFMLVGPATNAGSLLSIWRQFGKRSTMIHIGSIIFVSLLFGWLLNRLYQWFAIDPKVSLGHVSELMPAPVQWFSTAVFILLLLNLARRRFLVKNSPENHRHTHD